MAQRIRLAVAVVVLFVLLGTAASARAAGAVDCGDARPNTIRLGIPRERSNAATTDLAVAALRSHYRDVCGGVRPLEIRLAFGSDYQMLEWLQEESIDAAVVTDFALWMLGTRPLSELQAPDGTAMPRIPRVAFTASKVHGRWQRTAMRDDEYKRFLDEVYASEARPATTLALASHLSTTGFLDPVKRAAEHFETKLLQLPEHDRAKQRDRVWQTFFAATRFTLDCNSIDGCIEAVARDRQPLAGNAKILFFPGEEVLEQAALPPGSDATRERLVMSQQKAKDHFSGELPSGSKFVDVKGQELGTALDTVLEHPEFRHILEPEPLYGTRIYAFTPDESLRLIRQQQRRSGEDQLALVLPGGGVKAAYQTGIIGTLYKGGQLRNATQEESDEKSLAVRTVIGTSGGALLGFFVSQLQPNDKADLVQLLWKPNQRTLDTHDVFGFTDLPQYVSIGVAFLIFCILLAFFTSLARSPFYQRGPTPNPSWRGRLIPIAILFVAAPLLVRKVIGGEAIEDVPVIEGMFYSIMALLVMFADHCIVDAGAGQHTPRPTRRHALILLVTGVVMLALALFANRPDGLLDQPVTFGIAFTVLGLMFIGAPLLLLRMTQRAGTMQQRLSEVFVAMLGVIFVLWAVGAPRGRAAQMGAFAVLVVLAIVTYLYARAQRSRRGAPLLLTICTVYATAVLCWPRNSPHEFFSFAFLTAESLDLKLAAFLASLGIVFLVVAVAIAANHDTRYSIDDVEPFFLGLTLVLLHVGITLGAVVTMSWLTDGYIHSLEMTPSFWKTLLVAATLSGLLIVKLAPRFPISRKALTFLTGEHRNGALLPRRYARMLAVTSMGVLWWNFVIAPAIYGNRQATSYITSTIEKFQKTRGSSFAPTARFIVTANLLERDGTNYFLFHPSADQHEAASPQVDGVQWWKYPTTTAKTNDPCAKVIGPQCHAFVRDVVIASGSPFPIFAAHKVEIPRGRGLGAERNLERAGVGVRDGAQWFVDGGYSNNIPVDAAKAVDAKQVLIVHSANPLEGAPHDAVAPTFTWRPGRLVMNAGRLPGFLFERSQHIDRLSRQNLFVVALAPALTNDWPNLAQFDQTTVQRMLDAAEQQVDDRIGIVESWGQPRLEAVDAH
ncbi:MAG TPA: hypothetical protein VGF48_03495 [Thermoanaerobaculia bacterium]|jgi:predicted acylesterase/phospholipase RssA